MGLKASERGAAVGYGVEVEVHIKVEEVRRGQNRVSNKQLLLSLGCQALCWPRSTIEVSTGDPHKSLRWVTRLREARKLAQGHTACLVRLRHGHLYLFTASWLCLHSAHFSAL